MINKKTIKVEKESAEELKKWISEKEITPLSLLESLEKDVDEKKFTPQDLEYDENTYNHGYNHALLDVLSLIKQYKEQLK